MVSGEQLRQLEQWASNNGAVLHENLELNIVEGIGVSWVSRGAIPPMTIVVSIPHNLSISWLCIKNSKATALKSMLGKLDNVTLGYFYLVHEWINRENSSFKPYLDTLPAPYDSSFTQPLWFDETADIAWLEGTDVWTECCGRVKLYEREWSKGIELLKLEQVDVGPYTWDLYKWAVSIYSSRSFTSHALQTSKGSEVNSNSTSAILGEQNSLEEPSTFPVLFPVMDATNHDHNAQVEWTYGSSSFELAVLTGFEPGRQIYNNYGPKGNGELLLGYGFCIPGNPFDTVGLGLKPPPVAIQDRIRSSFPHLFKQDGSYNDAVFNFSYPKDEVVVKPAGIMDYIPHELLEITISTLRHDRGISYSSPDDRENSFEPQQRWQYLPFIAQSLVHSLQLKKSRWPRIKTAPSNIKQEMAAIYVEGQRRIAQELITRFQKYIHSLVLSPYDAAKLAKSTPKHTPRLLSLESLHDIIFTYNPQLEMNPSSFLLGIQQSAGTTDLQQLRSAGWEDDIFVLLLCWWYLTTAASLPPGALPEYLPPIPTNSKTSSSPQANHIARNTTQPPQPHTVPGSHIPPDQEDLSRAEEELMPIVTTAAAEFPGSLWADRRWTPELLVTVGGAIMRYSTMTVACPSWSGDDDDGSEMEDRLCVLLMV